MKAGPLLKVSAALVAFGLCTYLAVVVYTNSAQSSRLKKVSIAVEQFHAKEDLYGKLLASWTEILPARCGKPTGTPAFVNFESITKERDGRFSLATNSENLSNLSADDLAKLLDVKTEVVRSALETLNLLGSSQIIQTGAEVEIISPESDTHGYLHIDQSCPDAATYAFWSEQAGNFTVDHPGRYIGLKSLGTGWYYFVEQR